MRVNFEIEVESDSDYKPVVMVYCDMEFDAVRDPHATGDSPTAYENFEFNQIIIDGQDITDTPQALQWHSYLIDEMFRQELHYQ